jgi:diguanylate cyclase
MDNIAAGGLRLFVRGVGAHLVGAALGVLTLGLAFAPQSQTATILACLPFLVLYPLALGWATYRMSQKLATHARELERLSQTDGLTGLWNRRHWEDLLAAEFTRCRSEGAKSSLLLFDLDHFKRVNDTEGHAAGDAALRSFALFLRMNLRPDDIIGRYGGEEFGVILPDLGAAEAQAFVELLLIDLRTRAGQADRALRCTASAGLACYRPDMADFVAWISETDRCLYAAKANGRDCVVVSCGIAVQPASLTVEPPVHVSVGHLADGLTLQALTHRGSESDEANTPWTSAAERPAGPTRH